MLTSYQQMLQSTRAALIVEAVGDQPIPLPDVAIRCRAGAMALTFGCAGDDRQRLVQDVPANPIQRQRLKAGEVFAILFSKDIIAS